MKRYMGNGCKSFGVKFAGKAFLRLANRWFLFRKTTADWAKLMARLEPQKRELQQRVSRRFMFMTRRRPFLGMIIKEIYNTLQALAFVFQKPSPVLDREV